MKSLTLNGQPFAATPGKVICVGRNYAEHARELNNPVPTQPLLFFKPASALQPVTEPINAVFNGETLHFETELALLIGKTWGCGSQGRADEVVAGIGLALDLTARELQSRLKEKGHPWELAKGFDGACPLSDFVLPPTEGLDGLTFTLSINGNLRQEGRVSDMLTPPQALLEYITRYFSLLPGDIVLTGTPAGVGALQSGDVLSLDSNFGVQASTRVC